MPLCIYASTLLVSCITSFFVPYFKKSFIFEMSCQLPQAGLEPMILSSWDVCLLLLVLFSLIEGALGWSWEPDELSPQS